VLGNHDVYVGADAVAEGLARLSGVRLLRNEWVRIEEEGEAFCLAGFEDPGKGWTQKHARSPELERLAGSVPSELPSLLLVHRPSFFRQAASLGFRLSLAGHTHGGQVSLPFAPERNLARLISPWTRGVVRSDGAVLYVNRGLGVAGLPLRLNCPREVAVIRLSGRAP